MSASLLELVVHYQKKVERNNDEEKILHCFNKLQKLPITVEVLSQTGVGKTVNAFRRDPGPVGETARQLVSKWKRIFEENEQREKRLKAERTTERDKNRRAERGRDRDEGRHRGRERGSEERSEGREEERNYDRDEEDEDGSRDQSRDQSREQSHERSASRSGSEASDRMEVDEARALREAEEAARAEAVAARQAEAERRARDEEKRRRHEERAKREAVRNGVTIKEEPRSRDGRDKHSDKHSDRHSDRHSDKHSSGEKHRKESKHRRHGGDAVENGHDAEPLREVKVKTEPREVKKEPRENGNADEERDHHSSSHHRSSSKHSSSAGHSSSEKHSSSDRHSSEKHSLGEKRSSSSEKHASRERSRGDDGASSSKSHHKSRSNGDLHPDEAGTSSAAAPSSSKKSSHADSDNDASREARRSKHKSKRDKHEKRSSKSDKREDKKSVKLREVDFLCQPGGNESDSDRGAGASFADALGGSDATPKKKKKKSKSSSSRASPSASSSAHAPARSSDPLPSAPPPPPPPPAELLEALPEISATYRPLPRPAVPAGASARPPAKRALDEDEALNAMLAGKNKRTKVYSGARSVGWSRVPTLMHICLRCLMENIDNVEYTGGVPYEILRPVLEKCTAVQLRDIEYYNPYLLEDTDGLWQVLVKKEFKAERREEMETWREMHARCSEEREHKYNKLRSMIEGKRKESLASSRKTKVAYEHTVAKPPRNVARKQAKHGTAVAMSQPAPTVLAGGGPRPPRPAPGADPTSRPAAAGGRTAAPPKKKAPLMAKVLRAMGRR